MKRQRTLGFKPVSKKVRFFVTMPLTGVPLSLKLTPNWGCAPDVDRSAVLYAASLASKMYDTSAKLTFGVVEKNIWGYKKLQGAPKTYKERKKPKKNQSWLRPWFYSHLLNQIMLRIVEAIIGLELCEQSCAE